MANETKGGKQRGKQPKNSTSEAKNRKTTTIKAKPKKPEVKKTPPKPEKKTTVTRANKNEEKVKSPPKVTSKKANIKASPVVATRRKKMPKADVYKNRHSIGRRTAGRVHSYKETEVAVVFPDGYWEDLVKSSRLASTSVKDGKNEHEKEKNCSPNRKRKSTELHEETVKKVKKKDESEKKNDVDRKVKKETEEKKKEEKVKKSDEKKAEVKKGDPKTKTKIDDKKKKPESPKKNLKDDKKSPKKKEKKPKKEESEPEEEEEEEEEIKPRKPRFADIQPRAPRIKRTACLNANAIVSLMYEKDEPVKKPKIDASEADSSDSESLDWEVSFPKWKPADVKRPPSPVESKKSPKKDKKSKKKTGNRVPEFSPWSPPRRMASLNAQAILTACRDDRSVKKNKDIQTKAKEKESEPTEKVKESEKTEKPKKKDETKKPQKTVKTEASSLQQKNGHKESVTSSTEKSKAASSNKSPEVQIVEVKKSPSSTPLPLAPSFRPSAYIPPPPPQQSSMHSAVFPDYMRYPHGGPSHARSLGTQTSFPLPPSQRHPYPQYSYPGGAPSPYPTPQPHYSRDLWSPHSYGRGDRLPFPQFKDTRQPMRYPTPTPPQSPFHPGSQQPYSPYPAASNVYQPYPAFDSQASQPIPPAPPKPPQQRQPPQRHCLAPTMPQPPQHHHHATPKAFQCPPPTSFSTSANSLPSSSSFSSPPTAHSSQSQPGTSSQKEDTKILYNSGGSKFHTKPESKVMPSSSSGPSEQASSSTSKSSSIQKPEDKSPKAGPCSAPSTSSVVMTVCATGAKNSNGATAGGCSFQGGIAQSNNCQPFMLSTISAEGSFPIVPFQQYGTSAFAVPTFEDQQRLTFGYYQPAGPLIQTMPGESVFVQHPIGLQPLHHPQVKVLVHNTGFVPTGVCPDVGNDSEIVKPVAMVPVDKAKDVKKTESLPHLVPIAPKRPAPVAIAPRPSLSTTHVTTVLTQPQPTAAVQAAQPKKSAKSSKAPSTEPKHKTVNPQPSSSPKTTASSDAQATTASTASSTTATTTTSDAQTNKRKSDRQKKEPSPTPTKKKKQLTPVVTVTVDPCQPLNLSSSPTTAKDVNRNLPPLMINITEENTPLRRMSPRLASPNISPQISKKQKTSPTPNTPKAKPISPLSSKKKDTTPSPNSKKLKSKENKQKNISPNTRSSRASPNTKKDETPPKQKKEEKRLSIDGRKSLSPTPKKKEKKSMWEWSGNSQQSDNPVHNQKTYLAIKHKVDGDIIHKRDCVLVKSGPRKKDIPFVAKICSLWEKEGEMYMSVFWYYRPEHTETDKLPRSISCELFASKHKDIIPINCIEDKCYVLTFNEYARYRAEMKSIQDRSPARPPVVPALPLDATDSRSHRLPPLGADPESVFLCRKVYDVKLKRVLKNPQIHSPS